MNSAGQKRPDVDTARVLVLLSGIPEADDVTRTGVLAADPSARFETDPSVAAEAARESAFRVFVWDGREAGGGLERIEGELAEAGPDSTALLLLLAESPSEAERLAADRIGDYLRRPFPPAALRAYIDSLLSPGTASPGDRVRARLPSRSNADELYGRAVAFVGSTFDTLRAADSPELGSGRTLAEEIHTDLLHRNALVLRSLEPHSHFDLATHSANVAVIAGKISMGVASDPEEITRVIQAGLVHDVGMARLPQSLLEKEGPLTEDEWEEVRRHPLHGDAILETAGEPYAWLRTIVLQEHERLNGRGYPQGLRGSDIDPIALTIGVADVFEALSHPRAYRSPFTALDALEQVVGMQGDYFPRPLVEALLNEISSFPLDSFVQLSTGEIAQVVSTNADNLMRPEVIVLWDSCWRPLADPLLRALASEPEITIARALSETELPIT